MSGAFPTSFPAVFGDGRGGGLGTLIDVGFGLARNLSQPSGGGGGNGTTQTTRGQVNGECATVGPSRSVNGAARVVAQPHMRCLPDGKMQWFIPADPKGWKVKGVGSASVSKGGRRRCRPR